ncbi:MAG: hypothetical protein ACKOAD_01215, partial [Gammaproteobacteria bacterium]
QKFTDKIEGGNSALEFLERLEVLGGSDFPECMELSLRKAHDLEWHVASTTESANIIRNVFMVFDAPPHAADASWNLAADPERKSQVYKDSIVRDEFPSLESIPSRLDWREEIKRLADKGIKVHVMTCNYASPCTEVVGKVISETTFGSLGNLSNPAKFMDEVLASMRKDIEEDKIAYEILAKAKTEEEARKLAANSSAFLALMPASEASGASAGSSAAPSEEALDAAIVARLAHNRARYALPSS